MTFLLKKERNETATRNFGRTMVADRAMLTGLQRRLWKNGAGQSAVYQCGVVDRQDRDPVTRSAGTVWSLELGVSTIQPLVKTDVWKRLWEILRGNAELAELLLDSTIVKAHQHAADAKGGETTKRSVALAGTGASNFTPR